MKKLNIYHSSISFKHQIGNFQGRERKIKNSGQNPLPSGNGGIERKTNKVLAGILLIRFDL